MRVELSFAKTRKPAEAGFLTTYSPSSHSRRIKAALFNHRKHIRHILDHDPGGIGDGVDIVLGIVRYVGAGHQVQVGECGVEAFAGAGVQLAERRVAVDQQYRIVGCGLGHGGEAAGQVLSCHGVNPQIKKNYHRLCCETDWVAAVRGFADRTIYTKTRQTRKSPTHNRHKTSGSRGRLCHV